MKVLLLLILLVSTQVYSQEDDSYQSPEDSYQEPVPQEDNQAPGYSDEGAQVDVDPAPQDESYSEPQGE